MKELKTFSKDSFDLKVFRKSAYSIINEIGDALEKHNFSARSKKVSNYATSKNVRIATLHAPSVEAAVAVGRMRDPMLGSESSMEVISPGRIIIKSHSELGNNVPILVAVENDNCIYVCSTELEDMEPNLDNMYCWQYHAILMFGLLEVDNDAATYVDMAADLAIPGGHSTAIGVSFELYELCSSLYAFYKDGCEILAISEQEMIQKYPIFANASSSSTETEPEELADIATLQSEYAIGSEEYDDETYTVSSTLINILKMQKYAGMRKFMLRGEAGCGKTTDAKMLSRVLKVPLFTFTCSRNTKETDLVSTFVPEESGYKMVSSSIVEAAKIPAVCEIQEPACIDKQSVLTALNGLLDEGAKIRLVTGEVVELNPDTIYVFTTNADYVGCRPMNESVLSRMDEIIDYPFLTNNDFIQRATKKIPNAEPDVIRKIALIVTSIRRYMKESGVMGGVCGMRECFACIKAITAGLSINEAIKYTLLGKVSINEDIREEVYEAAIAPYLG